MTGRRIGALLLILALMGLAACKEAPEPTEPQAIVGVCLRQESDPQDGACREALEEGLSRAGFVVQTVDGKNDQTRQNAQIEELIAQGCALLIIEPVIVADAEGIVERLRQADTPAVFINREPEQAVLESWERISFVGSDATQPGLLQGQIVLEQPNRGDVNDDGVVSYFVLAGPEDHMDAQLRTEYCAKELTFAGVEAQLLGQKNGDWSRESGRKLCAEALAEFGVDIEVIFCNSDAIALGALEAIQSGGWAVGQDLYLVGIGAEDEALEMVRQGSLTGTVRSDTQAQAEKILQVARQLLAGEKVQRKYYIDYRKITAQNVDEVIDNS